MYLTMETVLLWFGSKETSAQRFWETWISTRRRAFALCETQASELFRHLKPELTISSEAGIFFCNPDLIGRIIQLGVTRLVFLGDDIVGSIETNLRIAAALRFQCILCLINGQQEILSEETILRLSKFSDLNSLEDLERKLPVDMGFRS